MILAVAMLLLITVIMVCLTTRKVLWEMIKEIACSYIDKVINDESYDEIEKKLMVGRALLLSV